MHYIIGIIILFAFNCVFAKDADLLSLEVTHFSNTYNISAEEFTRRQKKSEQAGRIRHLIRQDLPNTFGGLYSEHKPEFRMVFLFTGDAKSQLARYTHDPEFVAKEVPYSLVHLREAMETATDKLSESGLNFLGEVDIKKSIVTIDVLDPDEAKKLLKEILDIYKFIKIRKTTGFIELTDLKGGEELYYPRNSCSSGFNVRHDWTFDLGILSAGHCNNQLNYRDHNLDLVFQTEKNKGSYDLQWHKQPIRGVPLRQENKIDRGDGVVRSITRDYLKQRLKVNDPVCKSGITTGLCFIHIF